MLNSKLCLNETIFTKDKGVKSTRDGFGDGIILAGRENENVVVLTADLEDSIRVSKFKEEFPKRFIEVGIAEQNMAGIAGGLALSGKIPFITSFAVFNPGRNWEQIRLSVSYQNTNVKVVGSHAGLSACADGGSAQALEDIALTRVLPNLTVINPLDYFEVIKATVAAAKHKGPIYLRIYREETPVITTKDSPFEIGKAYTLIEGKDITILSTGPITYEALEAAKQLKAKYKISAEVISCSTIKPLDEKTILESIAKTKKVVTLEEHNVMAGFGGAVCELLSEKHPIPVTRIGVEDKFGQSGTYKELKDKYGISSHHITKKILDLLKN